MQRWYPALFALSLAACKFGGETASDSPGDTPADAMPPSALGSGSRISAVVQALTQPDSGVPPSSSTTGGRAVDITGASLIIIDTYSETGDGKNVGSVYVEDLNEPGKPLPPYSGIELYKPTYSPASLLVAPGDVLDMTGLYQNYQYSEFTKDSFSPELSEPIVSFRFEYTVPPPVVIDPSDLSVTVATSLEPKVFAQGLRWESMLVEVDDVTVLGNYTDSAGRVSVYFSTPTYPNGSAENDTSFANQLMPIDTTDPAYSKGAHYSKVIGIVGFFFNFTISPRSPADFVK